MIGQSQVTEPLMTALRTGRIGHAYLFSGPRGCGKTTSARILARCLNCAEGPTDTPCGTCPSCVELSRDGGGSLDVVEIDAASHGGVDDARDLRERAVFAPARDRFKIFIIDEAHMVTPGGFNALLKIVEEPPPHVKFIFATTEPDKVIGTIRSRTHHYPFRLIAPGTLIDYVQALCDSESVQVEPGVLPLVVRSGGGSVRDTLSILDQLIAGSEGSLVTAERAAGLLGFTHAELLDDVVVALGAHDAAGAFRATDRVVQTGQDPRRFVEDLLERLRDLIVVGATTVDGAAAVFRGVPQDQLTRMFAQSQSFARGELSRIADTVSAGLDKMAGATAPRLQLELMIARALVASEEHASRVPAASAGVTAPVAQEQNASGSAATSAGAAAPTAGAPRPPARPAQAPAAAPERPAHDPLAALAAARSAVTDPEPAASPSAPQQGIPNAGTPQPSAPNAAQTAASIREFLRDEPAAAGSEPTAAAPASDPGSAQRSAPAPGSGAAPHPNEGAAGFGRPISDILSSSQIASIGTESAASATPAPAAPAPADAASAASPAASPSPAPAAPNADGPGAAAPSAGSPDPREQGAPGSPEQSDASGPEEPAAESGLEDLLELWPDLLEEILERDREAWNAVRPITPMGLDGDVLTIGLASQSDLAAFKAAGAGPLRETILSAVGISVKYVPKRLPEAGSDGPPQAGAREAQPGAADAEEPHPAGSSSHDDPVQRAAARLSALGPALAAPAWADPPPAPPEGVAAEAGAAEDTAASEDAADPEAAPESPHSSSAPESGDEPEPALQSASQPAPVSAQQAAGPESGTSNDAVPNDAASNGNDPADEAPGPLETTRPDPSVGDYVEPADDPYGEGDPYAGGDPYDSGASVTPASARMSAPAPAPASVPTSSPEIAPARGPAPAHVPAPEPASASEPAPAAPSASRPARDGDAAERDTPSPRMAPSFTRYGEAVVREVLGARFIEERPLPPRLEG